MATMQEIANLAGVSRGTVDRVLNNRGSVNEETRDKILEIAKLMNYEPNKAGIALAAQKKDIKIGVLIYGKGNPFFDEILAGIQKRLQDLSIYGCSLVIRQTPSRVDEQLAAMEELSREKISGLIITPFADDAVRQRMDELSDRGIPVVTMNSDMECSKRIAYVGSDSFKAGETAGGLMGLFTGGKAEVGVITGSKSIQGHAERIRGFQSLTEKKYPGIHIEAVEECGDDDYKSYDTVQRMLLEYPTIDAFFFNSGAVYGGCKAIYQLTSKPNFTVITFDQAAATVDFIQKDVITATICQDPFHQGYRALAVLADHILFGTLPEHERMLTDITIKIKESL